MTRDQNQHRGHAHEHDMGVSIMLLVLLIAIALHIPNSGEIGDTGPDRHGFFAHAIDLILNWGLSLGASSLLLSSRPRDDQDKAGQ